MTDRELIEAAAKAGGMPPWTWDEESGCINCQHRSDLTNMHFWNPLTDDGDALRLAVKLDLGVEVMLSLGETRAGDGDQEPVAERHNGEPCAATRRAIVRAAAAIGGHPA